MRIGFNLLYLLPNKIGGTETYARGVLSGLVRQKKIFEYLLFCNQENYGTFQIKNKSFKKKLINIPARLKFVRLISEQLLLPFYCYFQKIDVLMSFGYICPLFLPCKSAVFIYDLNWFFHPEEFSFFERMAWKLLVTLSAKRAEIIITSSENSQKDIIKILKIAKDKVKVIYGGVDRTRFKTISEKKRIQEIKNKYGIVKDYLLTVSAAYKFKNLVALVSAFKDLLIDFPDLQLMIVGLGGKGKTDLITKIKALNLQKKIAVTGWVPDEDLPTLYSAAKVYVHPSLYEGFGFPVLEAMACGCPVVSSRAASLPELIGDAGMLIDAKKKEKILGALKGLLSDERLTKELKRKGIQRSKDFSWEKAAKTILGIVDNQRKVEKELIQFYRSNKDYFQLMERTHDWAYYQPLLRILQDQKASFRRKRILDVGSGTGTLIRVLREVFQEPFEAVGTDISNIGENFHRKKGIKFIRADAQKLPFPEESFDFVFSTDAFEHLINPQKALEEMFRVTKKGGLILLRTRNYRSPLTTRNLFSVIELIKDSACVKSDLKKTKRLQPRFSCIEKADEDAVSAIFADDLKKAFEKLPGKILVFETWTKGGFWKILNTIPFLNLMGSMFLILFKKN